MTDNPDTRPMEAAAIPVSDTSHAPFIFYEGARTSGFYEWGHQRHTGGPPYLGWPERHCK